MIDKALTAPICCSKIPSERVVDCRSQRIKTSQAGKAAVHSCA